MLTVREIQSRTSEFFQAKGVPNPRLEADLLLAHILEKRRLDLYLDIERPLTEAQLDRLRPMVKRRADREPLQYILGSVEFCGLLLKVDSRALIPRPETEELFQLILEALEFTPKRILDLGTGSGAIAIALARQFPEAEVTAVDYSADALALAQENEALHLSKETIRFLKGSWFEAVSGKERFDLIVSNPPYLSAEEIATAEPEVINYEPQSALAAGPEGLDDLRRILAHAPHHLSAGGLLALETGIAQHKELEGLAAVSDYAGTKSYCDMSGRERFFFTRAAEAPA